eukprot:Lithocolla_globosa_v1_NODE_1213_length_2782_cov_10.456546.p1 type:complete len:874 gc:universal NODE_1213_length_2782_cov_10.456546:2674-53(-)
MERSANAASELLNYNAQVGQESANADKDQATHYSYNKRLDRWQLSVHQRVRLGFPYELGPFSLHELGKPNVHIKVNTETSSYEVTEEVLKLLPKDHGCLDMGQVSPRTNVTFSEPSKQRANIPSSAVSYVWAYPLPGIQDVSGLDLSNPVVNFVAIGGYIYFDAENKIVRANAVGLSSPDLFFGARQKWNNEHTEILYRANRLSRITLEPLKEAGAFWFCWINPGERLDENGTGSDQWPHGGFAYWFTDHPISDSSRNCFFPCEEISQPEVSEGQLIAMLLEENKRQQEELKAHEKLEEMMDRIFDRPPTEKIKLNKSKLARKATREKLQSEIQSKLLQDSGLSPPEEEDFIVLDTDLSDEIPTLSSSSTFYPLKTSNSSRTSMSSPSSPSFLRKPHRGSVSSITSTTSVTSSISSSVSSAVDSSLTYSASNMEQFIKEEKKYCKFLETLLGTRESFLTAAAYVPSSDTNRIFFDLSPSELTLLPRAHNKFLSQLSQEVDFGAAVNGLLTSVGGVYYNAMLYHRVAKDVFTKYNSQFSKLNRFTSTSQHNKNKKGKSEDFFYSPEFFIMNLNNRLDVYKKKLEIMKENGEDKSQDINDSKFISESLRSFEFAHSTLSKSVKLLIELSPDTWVGLVIGNVFGVFSGEKKKTSWKDVMKSVFEAFESKDAERLLVCLHVEIPKLKKDEQELLTPPVLGILEQFIEYDKPSGFELVPGVVSGLLQILLLRDPLLETEGLYRITPSVRVLNKCQQDLEKSGKIPYYWPVLQVPTLTFLIKRVVTSKKLLDTYHVTDPSLVTAQALQKAMPRGMEDYTMFVELISHLRDVAAASQKNSMSVGNLAKIFCTVFFPSHGVEKNAIITGLVVDWITNGIKK